MEDPARASPPKQNLAAALEDMARYWSELAKVSADVAHAKRAVFLAYVAEGFTEYQALELVK